MADNIRFVRWQGIQLTQLGFVLNLVLSFAVAGLGLWLSLLRDDNFRPRCWAKCLFVLSAFALVLSIATGLWCSLNRLWDFRITAGIARGKWEGVELAVQRAQMEKLDNRTWALLYWEICSFVLATLLLIATLILAYWPKLF